ELRPFVVTERALPELVEGDRQSGGDDPVVQLGTAHLSENVNTGSARSRATWEAICIASVDFPDPGRPPMIVTSPGLRPPMARSRSCRPVGSPRSASPEAACSMASMPSV